MQNGEELASYNMGNAKKDDGEDSSEIQLHRMKQDHFIEAQVQEGDTLQAIALRFYCSVSFRFVYYVLCLRFTKKNTTLIWISFLNGCVGIFI